jgi:hypothetical protein
MKGSEQKDIIILGKLQAIHEAMNTELPQNKELRAKFLEAKRMVFQVLDAHWENCNKLITEDDS